jgi:hypothetical protein
VAITLRDHLTFFEEISARSLLTPAHSRENFIALWRISFQLIGIRNDFAAMIWQCQWPGN